MPRASKKAVARAKPESSLQDEIDALKLRMQAMEQRFDNIGSTPLFLADDQALLRDARNAAGWSMRAVAEALGVSSNLVMWWEQGKMRMPAWRARTVVRMFRRSGVAPPAWPSLGVVDDSDEDAST